MSERKLTIRDIARLSGVSRSTVSLVLNNDRRISEETRTRVQSIIQRSGYEPNAIARGLARRRAGMVAVVVPRTSSHVFSDHYVSEAISGIGDVLAGRGYRMLIEMANDAFIQDRAHHKLFREGQIDGMLIIGALSTDEYILEISRRFPVVLVNSMLDDIPSVYADNHQGMLRMIEYLVGLGHRRIGYIGGLDITTVGADRTRGYREGLAAAGLPGDDRWVAWGNFSEESGVEACRHLIARESRLTAIVAANDMMAIGALRAAEEAGMAVPGQLTLVGADDVSLASYVRPRLTTLRQPMYDIGRSATNLLLELSEERREAVELAARPASSIHLFMSTEIVVRESSARADEPTDN
ncbi:MAG: LacI family DNA-binding transcriptional regulator [Candidatus Eisenbacteria bacterium]|nr:LacI family DNA-binding transcriptional regulator [Candidatus Eisenbacteria bacterium]